MRRVSGRRTRPSEYASWKWNSLVRGAISLLRRTHLSRNDGRGPRRLDRAPPVGRRRSRSRDGPRRLALVDEGAARTRLLVCGRPSTTSLCDFLDDLVNPRDAAEAAEKRRTSRVAGP